jgi:hypothetical protein
MTELGMCSLRTAPHFNYFSFTYLVFEVWILMSLSAGGITFVMSERVEHLGALDISALDYEMAGSRDGRKCERDI